MKKYKSSGKVWVYSSENAAWHFVYLDKEVSSKIKESIKTKTAFGSVKVKATIGKTSFETSIFRDKRSESYLLPLKKSVRLAEDIFEGEIVDFFIEVKS